LNWQKIGTDFWTHVSKPFEYINGQLRDSNTKQLVLDFADLTESPPFPTPSISFALPPGLILPYGGSTVPSGSWALLLGTGINVSRTTYAFLFSVIGTTFGAGDGLTTFGLPPTAGIHLRGAGTSMGYTAPVSITLGQQIQDAFQGHRHDPAPGASSFFTSSGSPATLMGGGGSGALSANTGNPITDGVNGTPRTGTETRVKALGVNYIITTGLPI
jgi:microcystin-dependent protein